jgi:hypothetical protein
MAVGELLLELTGEAVLHIRDEIFQKSC